MRVRTLRHFVLLAATVVLVAACSGNTTAATNVVQQPGGSDSAQLNYVVSCGPGQQCSSAIRYEPVAIASNPPTPFSQKAGPKYRRWLTIRWPDRYGMFRCRST